MHRGPRQREHRAAAARHWQVVEAADRFSLGGDFLAREHDVNVRLDDPVRAQVGRAIIRLWTPSRGPMTT